MDEQPEVIQQQMEDTRAALVEKLEALEDQVAETVNSTSHAVQDTTTAVTDTVESVRDTVENVSGKVQETVADLTDKVHDAMATVTDKFQQTVQSVSDAFDLRLQVERHPWLVVGGAVVVGFTGASILNGLTRRTQAPPAPPPQPAYAASSPPPRAEAPPNGQPAASPLPDWLRDELGRLRGLAIGSLMSVVRDLARQAMPGPIGQRLAEEVDVITGKLGAETIPDRPAETASPQPAGRW